MADRLAHSDSSNNSDSDDGPHSNPEQPGPSGLQVCAPII